MTKTESKSEREGLMARLGQPQDAPPWSLIDVLITLFVLLIATILLGSSLALVLLPGASIALTLGWIIGLAVTSAYILVARRRDAAQMSALRLEPMTLPMPYLLLLGMALAITADVISLLASQTILPVPVLAGLSLSDPLTWVLGGVFVLLVQPLGEGLVFQGMTLPWLRARMGPWPGLLLTSALYALYYYLIFASNLAESAAAYAVLHPLLMGAGLSMVRVHTGSTRASILAGMGAGLFALLAAFILVR